MSDFPCDICNERLQSITHMIKHYAKYHLKKIKNSVAYMPKSKNQEHLSPDLVFETIEKLWNIPKSKLYDPCPPGTPYKAPIFFNGLYGPWFDFNYVNSPFAVKILEQFVAKSHEQAQLGKIVIMLLPTKTDQKWFQNIIWKFYKDTIYWFDTRLHFKNDKYRATDTHFLVKMGRVIA